MNISPEQPPITQDQARRRFDGHLLRNTALAAAGGLALLGAFNSGADTARAATNPADIVATTPGGPAEIMANSPGNPDKTQPPERIGASGAAVYSPSVEILGLSSEATRESSLRLVKKNLTETYTVNMAKRARMRVIPEVYALKTSKQLAKERKQPGYTPPEVPGGITFTLQNNLQNMVNATPYAKTTFVEFSAPIERTAMSSNRFASTANSIASKLSKSSGKLVTPGKVYTEFLGGKLPKEYIDKLYKAYTFSTFAYEVQTTGDQD